MPLVQTLYNSKENETEGQQLNAGSTKDLGVSEHGLCSEDGCMFQLWILADHWTFELQFMIRLRP